MRHGQIASNLEKIYSGRSDESLTEKGRQQVTQASRELAGAEIESVYTSPLWRARQTAEVVVSELGWDLPINIDDSFNELKMGPWEGMSEADVAMHFPAEWATWNSRPAELRLDGRETLAQLQQRVLEGMRSIQNSGLERSALIVTHVAVIRVIALFANAMDLNLYKSIPVDNAKVFSFPQLDI